MAFDASSVASSEEGTHQSKKDVNQNPAWEPAGREVEPCKRNSDLRSLSALNKESRGDCSSNLNDFQETIRAGSWAPTISGTPVRNRPIFGETQWFAALIVVCPWYIHFDGTRLLGFAGKRAGAQRSL